MKRIFLFILTNLAVVMVLGVVASLLGANRYLTAQGLNLASLLVFAFIFGFGGAIISLLISKPVAKWSMSLRSISAQQNTAEEAWIVQTVTRLAAQANIGMPEVAIYDGEPNAFATGAFKNSALVAVSTGLMQSMTREEVEAVLGHEVSHIANGDMVTLTLLQGVINTFVIFLSRVIGYAVDKMLNGDNERRSSGAGFYMTYMVLEMLLGFLGSMIVAWYSRQREYRADAGAGKLLGQRQTMIRALQRLGGLTPGALPSNMQGITSLLQQLVSGFRPGPVVDNVALEQSQHSSAPQANSL